MIPQLGAMALDNRIEAWNLPLGVISHLYRDLAAGLPGNLPRAGLGTFVDPRLQCGKVNARTTDDLVSLTELAGEELLFYRVPRPLLRDKLGSAIRERGLAPPIYETRAEAEAAL